MIDLRCSDTTPTSNARVSCQKYTDVADSIIASTARPIIAKRTRRFFVRIIDGFVVCVAVEVLGFFSCALSQLLRVIMWRRERAAIVASEVENYAIANSSDNAEIAVVHSRRFNRSHDHSAKKCKIFTPQQPLAP